MGLEVYHSHCLKDFGKIEGFWVNLRFGIEVKESKGKYRQDLDGFGRRKLGNEEFFDVDEDFGIEIWVSMVVDDGARFDFFDDFLGFESD